jgi:hypothetical protein
VLLNIERPLDRYRLLRLINRASASIGGGVHSPEPLLLDQPCSSDAKRQPWLFGRCSNASSLRLSDPLYFPEGWNHQRLLLFCARVPKNDLSESVGNLIL